MAPGYITVTRWNIPSSKFRAKYLRIHWAYDYDFGCVRIVSMSRYAPHLKKYNLVEFDGITVVLRPIVHVTGNGGS